MLHQTTIINLVWIQFQFTIFSCLPLRARHPNGTGTPTDGMIYVIMCKRLILVLMWANAEHEPEHPATIRQMSMTVWMEAIRFFVLLSGPFLYSLLVF